MVPCQPVLARNERVIVAAGFFAAYPSCFDSVQVWGLRRPGEEAAHFDASMVWASRLLEAGPGQAPPESSASRSSARMARRPPPSTCHTSGLWRPTTIRLNG